MLLKLHSRSLRCLTRSSSSPIVARITEDPKGSDDSKNHELLLVRGETESLPDGFRGYLVHRPPRRVEHADTYQLGTDQLFLGDGDVVRLDPLRTSLTALYRKSSSSNTFLVTERCDNLCVMCSQPPKDRDDGWLVDDLERAIPLVSKDATEIGVSGGEPALLGARLVQLLSLLRAHLPRTAVHVLTNGRRFAERDFSRAIAEVAHPDLMMGIPLYSDLPEEHDYVVQQKGAFEETLRGILHLKRDRVRVEIRFVLHRETVPRLPDFARFVARNLTFVDHVAFMGLELVGFARSNQGSLWMDPLDYQSALLEATMTLHRAGLRVSIYNEPLCTLHPRLTRFYRKSISDWKNTYLDECEGCSRRDDCGGFFASSAPRRSRGIAPFTGSQH